jgi:hypothetical protein
MKARWIDANAVFEVIDQVGDQITLAIPCTIVIDGKEVNYIEEQVLDEPGQYELMSEEE